MPHFPGCRVSGSPPPLSSQDPDVAQHCAPSPASLEVASFTSALPARPLPNLASSGCTAQKRRLRNQGIHRTERGLCQGLRSDQVGAAAVFHCPCP